MRRFEGSLKVAALLAGAVLFAAGPALARGMKGGHAGRLPGMHAWVGQTNLSDNEVRTLMFLHAVNVAEIVTGNLAQSHSRNNQVQAYGRMLSNDHHALDRKVMDLAQNNGISFRARGVGGAGMQGEAGTGGAGMQGEAGSSNSNVQGQGGAGTAGMQAQGNREITLSGPEAQTVRNGWMQLRHLRGLRGTTFDRTFLNDIQKDHARVIELLKQQEPRIQNRQLAALVKDAIPVLTKHEQEARHLLTQMHKK